MVDIHHIETDIAHIECYIPHIEFDIPQMKMDIYHIKQYIRKSGLSDYANSSFISMNPKPCEKFTMNDRCHIEVMTSVSYIKYD